jgi:putative membrane protein
LVVSGAMSSLDDPRVLFAAERTLLAWNRTGLALMAFGFAIERFGLFVQFLMPERPAGPAHDLSFWVGIAFVLLGSWVAAAAVVQFRKVLKTLQPAEIPERYNVHLGMFANLLVTVLGILLIVYLYLSR